MPDISQLAAIASRYATRMADAMIRACVAKAVETGERLEVPERGHAGRRPEKRPDCEPADEEWRRLVEGNAETRASWRW